MKISSAVRHMRDYIYYRPITLIYFTKYFGIRKAVAEMIYFHYTLLKRAKWSLTAKQDTKIVYVNGVKMAVMPNDKGISEELIMWGTHEPLATEILESELAPDMVCIDIGANIGYYALLESKIISKNGKVIAIEPVPSSIGLLKRNIALQEINTSGSTSGNNNNNIEVYNLAIGDVDGKVDFVITQFSNLNRVLLENEHRYNAAISDSSGTIVSNNIITVASKRLDTFVSERRIGSIDFIRMDVEGHENKIIKGMQQTLMKYKPLLMIEVHKDYLGTRETIDFLLELKSYGYELKYFIPKEIDSPLIASHTDIKKTISIDDAISLLERDLLPSSFNIFLI
jgi:FkbM family methyltransferase